MESTSRPAVGALTSCRGPTADWLEMIRDSRQPVEAHFHVVSDFRREIYDNSLAHPPAVEPTGATSAGILKGPVQLSIGGRGWGSSAGESFVMATFVAARGVWAREKRDETLVSCAWGRKSMPSRGCSRNRRGGYCDRAPQDTRRKKLVAATEIAALQGSKREIDRQVWIGRYVTCPTSREERQPARVRRLTEPLRQSLHGSWRAGFS